MPHVLCSISTKGRYDTTLPLALQSVINQTRVPDQIIIFDDNDNARDVRDNSVYSNLFKMMSYKGIEWEWVWSQRKGQHHNHQMANDRAREWVWRVDDDNIADPTVLETLLSYTNASVGGVGTACLTPSWDMSPRSASGKIELVDQEPNIQWGRIDRVQSVEHLHCSFLYRAKVWDYNLALSQVAHREETLFSWHLHKMGYQLLVVPGAVTWHLKMEQGGIRSSEQKSLYDRDNRLFQNFLKHKDHTIVVLDCGMGDHVVFNSVLPQIQNPLIFSCYPQITPGLSIQQAIDLFGDISCWNIYRKMSQWDWKQGLDEAFAKLYVRHLK